MRRDFEMERELPTEANYFRGIDELLESERFESMIKDEFPEDAPEWLDPVSRRQFVSVMGASLALAGVVGCNPSFKPASGRKALPYVKKPDSVIPGVPLFYASTFSLSGVATGVIVKAQEGRPLKVEGNPKHPTSGGSTNIYTQGALLDLYDPDRSKICRFKGQESSWDKARQAIIEAYQSHAAKTAKGSFAVLSENSSSPTLNSLIADATKAVGGQWVSYEPASPSNAWEGSKLAFGKAVTPVYQLDKAKVVLALDWDVHAAPVVYSRQLTARRKVRVSKESKDKGQSLAAGDMNRIYSVESMVGGTGVLADHRLPLKPSQIESFLRLIAEKVGVVGGPKPDTLSEPAKAMADAVAKDLLAAKGDAIVLVGNHLSPSAHALAAAVNAKLGAVGKTLTYIDPVIANAGDQVKALKDLTAEMAQGKVETLVILGTNPVYSAPNDVPFAEALKKVKTVVHLGSQYDETAVAANAWHINEAHPLESWGDARGHDGTASLQQPICAPVYGGKSAIELFAAMLAKPDQSPLGLVKATWKKTHDASQGDFEVWFGSALESGVIKDSASKPLPAGDPKLDWVKDAPVLADKGVEITFQPDPTVYDGRFANNGWLQECPKPITKLTWDCALICSPATALDTFKSDLPKFHYTGGENGRMEVEVVKLTVGGTSIEAPLFILPGHADGCVTIHYGYGRTKAGRVADVETKFNELLAINQTARVAVNAFALRSSTQATWAQGVGVERTTKKYILACTQGQHGMEGRRPARHGTTGQVEEGLAEYKKTKLPFAFANNPFVAASERNEIVNKLPGSPQELHMLEHGHDDHHDDHGHSEKHPKGHDSRVVQLSLIPDKNKQNYRRWAMAIDLGACTGCSACVVACVAENNIPVIGKTEVSRGRAMHWIRIDRYFAVPGEKGGTSKLRPDARTEALKDVGGTTVHVQPVNCQQCEKAPCEVVCPVGATVHSSDGLNDMAYNRCVGTRYCSNNCPYKVRRFNFIQYADYATESMRLVNNPEVTVRQRGVMEKCTYCTQRIRNAEIEAEREWDLKDAAGNPVRPLDATKRPHIRDGEILTACQQVCPSGAISFGDIADATSEVRAWKQEPTNYGLLAEFNTMPRTSYLAAVKNPNPTLLPKGTV